jgi:hypothetical protein
MSRGFLATISLAALLGCGAAQAGMPAVPPTKASCDALLEQFDRVVGKHAGEPTLDDAKKARARGERECAGAEFAKGAEYLKTALDLLGEHSPLDQR